jgi:alpha-D-ribose 1-methylphosphonate 5-phosphate C-P lyase
MMLFLEINNVDKLYDEIEEKDLYTKKDDDGYGIEKDTHVTIKYGFTDKVSDHEVMDICRKEKFDNIKLNKISIFENQNFIFLMQVK